MGSDHLATALLVFGATGCFPSFADLSSGSPAIDAAALEGEAASTADVADRGTFSEADATAVEGSDDVRTCDAPGACVTTCEASTDCVTPSVCGSGACGGLVGTYYDNADFTGRNIIRTDATVDFDWGYNPPDPRIAANHFSVRWLGHLIPRYSETYTFHATADDGVVLYINDVKVIDHWPPHPAVEDVGTIALDSGAIYDIKVEYHNDNNEGLISLAWSSPRQPKEIVPTSHLFP